MSELIDISVPLDEDLPIWPDSPGFEVHPLQRIEDGAEANVSRLDCDVHTGTHIDAPRHFVQNGATIDEIPLDVMNGPVSVIRIRDAVTTITADMLNHIDLPREATRILFRTSNSKLWDKHGPTFQSEYTALAPDAAGWLVERGFRCVGVDYLSVQHYNAGPETHQILLEGGVVIIEGLILTEVPPGQYELLCLPLSISGVEAAPSRVALRHLE